VTIITLQYNGCYRTSLTKYSWLKKYALRPSS
jgi:hypothetical protein